MGGTFNPIHFGHISIAQRAYEEFHLDYVLFIPSGKPYFKNKVLDKKKRYEMTKLAISDYPFFRVSDIEINREGNSYSYETLEELSKKLPDSELYFIVGADSVLNMDKWKNPDIIFNKSHVLLALRPGNNSEEVLEKVKEYKVKFSADISIINLKEADISSTKIRENVRKGLDISAYVPPKIIDYIKKNNLYR